MSTTYQVTSSIKAINSLMGFMARRGLGPVQELSTMGRVSGQVHTVPVNPVTVAGVDYVVCPYGETGWVKNARVDGHSALRHGKEDRRVVLDEVTGQQPEVVQAYWTANSFPRKFMDLPEAPTLADFEREVHRFPVFAVTDV